VIHALVAEDSITAAMFLTRLLEASGVRCRTVDTVSALRAALDERRWDLLLVDVDLPDAEASAGLTVARDHGAPVVALVRDRFDEVLARAAGVTDWLRKPFDQEEVQRMVLPLFAPEKPPS
jgi:DNA-binding response OmpR family regulator